MKNAKIPLIICGIITLALIAGLLIVQFLYPIPANPSSAYTEKKASAIFSYIEDGKGSWIEILGVTVELADYENLSCPAYFYSFGINTNGMISYFSNGEENTLTPDIEKNKECIEKAYDEFTKFEKITDNMYFDVPKDNDTVKVYLTTDNGYYLREYTKAEFESSVFADTYTLYGSNY